MAAQLSVLSEAVQRMCLGLTCDTLPGLIDFGADEVGSALTHYSGSEKKDHRYSTVCQQ